MEYYNTRFHFLSELLINIFIWIQLGNMEHNFLFRLLLLEARRMFLYGKLFLFNYYDKVCEK